MSLIDDIKTQSEHNNRVLNQPDGVDTMYGQKFLRQLADAKNNYAEAREAWANNTDRTKGWGFVERMRVTRELLRVHETPGRMDTTL